MITFACLVGGMWSSAMAEEGSGTRITILHTCDFHGRHLPFEVAPGDATSQTGTPRQPANTFRRAGRIGGFAALAGAVERFRQKRGSEHILLLHAGDTFSDDLLGNLTRGEAIIRMMNATGYDFAALGNHDFDYGFDQTRRLHEVADFPLRAANVIDEETQSSLFGEPFRLFERGGVIVGVLALGYHNTHETTAPKNVKGLSFTSGIEAARQYVPQLRKQADIVVVVSHQGTAVDKRLAREVAGIDLIVGGHSHDRLEPALEVESTTIVQVMSDTVALGEVRIDVQDGKVVAIEDELHMLWEDQFHDETMAGLIAEIRRPYRETLETVVGEAATAIAREYKQESPFDTLVADLLRQRTNAEVALLPGVGYGVTLRKGEVTREQLYALLPHPVKLATLELSGQQIHETLEQSATNLRAADPSQRVGGLIQTAGMTWTVDFTRPEGERVRDIRVAGAPLDSNRRYRVATHSGMLQGIHRYDQLSKGMDVQVKDEKVIDILEEHFRKSSPVSPPDSPQVTVIDAM
ncbi:bifunctional metallophosphatase/5'-nucleotidase [Maioricimonas rarisocia]|uniref:bifunctional metallophosphatase/5'-nucleotidase n=1 Tax=Maioricimonas rarisocia TaxID=2528026 RepID=UPI0018D21F75|nr:bifunctional UDP-sugar hydrolase/5'-nucleotidase [Maioricimonas rarisocia]